jgi:cobalamin synthase
VLTHTDHEVTLNWGIFDPGDAVRLAVLYLGKEPQMLVKGNFGPDSIIKKYENRNAIILVILGLFFVLFSPLFVWMVMILSIILLLIFIILLEVVTKGKIKTFSLLKDYLDNNDLINRIT